MTLESVFSADDIQKLQELSKNNVKGETVVIKVNFTFSITRSSSK